MPFDRFLIAPSNTGLQTNMKPWQINEDAFAELVNAYVFRGRVRKRFGSRFMGSGWPNQAMEPEFSRLRVNVGSTDAITGDFPPTIVPVGATGAIWKIGQMFTVGTVIFTVVVVNGAMLAIDTATGLAPASTATFDTTTGTLTITGNGANPATIIWFYPAEPVMGIQIYESGPINNQPTYAFDTRFAYIFAGGFWQRSGTGVTPIWHGNNSNFFYISNWRALFPPPVLFVSNFYALNPNALGDPTDDPIWTFDGTTWVPRVGGTPNGFYFLPAPGNPPVPQARYTGPYVKTARIVLPFKDRLVLLNTIENNNPNHDGTLGTNTQYPQRCRYSHNGSPFAQNAWYEPNQMDSSGTANGLSIADGAGYVDAPTEEQIVSAEFIKDRLIVFFEHSTWELAYTSNQILPFVWQKINTELGSEALLSSVPFDKYILTMGTTGVHACTGANVERIDTKIPDQVFQIQNKNVGVQRVVGIRDYYTEMVYWTFPSTDEPVAADASAEFYPNQVLVYNYRNDSWALNDDCITNFGYFDQQNGMTWSSTTETWENANFTWSSGTTAAQFRQVIAGNQEGYVFIIDSSESRNARNMQITNMVQNGQYIRLTIIDHTLVSGVPFTLDYGDYINIENANILGVGATFSTPNSIFEVQAIVDANTVDVGPATVTFPPFTSYLGGATASRVSQLWIFSKQWNPYIKQGRDVTVNKIDFGVTTTAEGQVSVNYFPSYSNLAMLGEAVNTGAILGTGVLETFPYADFPLEAYQEFVWHPVYFQTSGEAIQILLTMTPDQMMNPGIAYSDFELQGMILYTQPTTSRPQ